MPHSWNKPLYLSQQASSRPGLLQGLSHLPKNSTSLLLSLKVILKLWLKLSTPMRTLYLHLAICSLRPNLPLLPIIVFPFLMYVDLVTFTATKCIFVDKNFLHQKSYFSLQGLLVTKFVFWLRNWFRRVYHIVKNPGDEKFHIQMVWLFKKKKKETKTFCRLMFFSLNTLFSKEIVSPSNDIWGKILIIVAKCY